VEPVVVLWLQTRWYFMNEEMTRKCLQQVELICGHLLHRCAVTVNQVMVVTVKHSKWWLQLNQKEPLVQ
jgi:hypothetical protein